jgi:hypothetical protein
MTILLANDTLVATAWLGEILGAGMVGTTLPTDNSSNSTMAVSGFALVAFMSGSPQVDVGLRFSAYSVDLFAVKPRSNKPPWGLANNIAETLVRAAIKARPHRLTLAPAGYPPAQFHTAQVLVLPRRIEDPSSYAQYNMTLQINWSPVVL